MGASITLAGESLIAQKQGTQQILTVARFILANVPGLNPDGPVDRAAGKPAAGHIVGTYDVTQAGYVNPNQVVYSLMLGSDIGDFDWNWIGLETAENVLLMVAYVPTQQKRRNIPPLQLGNNVTRNFLVVFDGAQALTGLTIDASTWQHDFTVRLAGIDERERQSNRDIYGRACFFGSSLQLEKVADAYQLKPGTAYIEGVRIELDEPVGVTLPALPAKAWLDVALERQASDVVASWQVVFGATQADYADSNGVAHYLIPLTEITSTTSMTDLRPSQPITTELVKHFAARVGDYEQLRARATTKEDVGLGNLPNAKSDDPASDSSEILATTRALRAALQQWEDAFVGVIVGFDTTSPPPGFLRANGAAVSRTVYSRLFAKLGTRHGAGDGSTTFNLPDARGDFLRFLDEGRGVDPGRVLGSSQDGSIQSHGHTGIVGAAGGHGHTATTDVQGQHTHKLNVQRYSDYSYQGLGGEGNDGSVGHPYGHDPIQPAGAHAHNVSVSSVGDHSHPITIGNTGGNETRPRNIALLACIKY